MAVDYPEGRYGNEYEYRVPLQREELAVVYDATTEALLYRGEPTVLSDRWHIPDDPRFGDLEFHEVPDISLFAAGLHTYVAHTRQALLGLFEEDDVDRPTRERNVVRRHHFGEVADELADALPDRWVLGNQVLREVTREIDSLAFFMREFGLDTPE